MLIAKLMNVEYNWLLFVIWFESGFNTSAKNPNSSAVGLIQFTSSTAKQLGTTTTKLASMSAEEQLDYVNKYFTPYRKKITTWYDAYFAVFYPYAIGKPLTYVIGSQSGRAAKIAKANKVFDTNKDNQITKAEIIRVLEQKYYE